MTEKKMQEGKNLQKECSRVGGSSAFCGHRKTPDVFVLSTYKSISSNEERLANKAKCNSCMHPKAQGLTQTSSLFPK